MELYQVEYFLAVVDHDGIGAAASALGVAQPTISLAIRSLERELGVDLLYRVGRGTVLTSAGRGLVGPARRIVRDAVSAEGELVDAAGQHRGRLDIFVMPALAMDPVPQLIGAFRQAFPKVSIRIGDLREEESGASLIRDGHCEIVVCYLPASGTGGLEVCELGVQEYWAVFPPGTELPVDDPMPLSALPDESMVVVPKGSSAAGEVIDAITQAGRLRLPAAVVEHREARLAFVLAGVAGTFLERSIAQTAIARGAVVRRVEPRISRAYGLVYDPAALSPVGRAFVELARSDGGT